MATLQKITPYLWFDSEAEEAATAYTSIFQDARITRVSRYGEAGAEVHGKPPGTAMSVEFQIEGQSFVALNGGPLFRFTPAISFLVSCETQEEVDHYWERLSSGSDPESQRCGWLTDRYGVTWQIVPAALPAMLTDPDPAKAGRVMEAMMPMKKLDIATLRRAYDGAESPR